MDALLSGLEPAARIVVATLFNSLWEAALLAALVALVLRVLPNVNATTRYAAWCVALAASLLLPLATALPQIAVQQPAPQHAAVQHAAVQHALPVNARAGKAAAPAVTSTHRATAPAATAAPSSTFRLPERLHFSLPQYVALSIFAVWCIAALLLLVRLAINLWRLEHLKSDALPLPIEYRERLERWSLADKGEREVRLCTCESIEVPVAVGLFDSMILIPRHLLDSLSQSEVDQIILHELAHLRRADDWTNGFQRFIQALFFFNPAVLYIAQQLDLEREVACDDWVVDQTKEVRPYATCLTKMAEATAWPHRPLAAPGVFVTRRGLSVRVERLLRAGRNIRTSVSFGPTGAIVASLIVLFFLLQNVAPSFAFTMTQSQAAAQQVAQKAAVHPANVKVVKILADNATAAPAPAASATAKKPYKDLYIPPINVDTPPTRVEIPGQHVHVPAQHIRYAVPSVSQMHVRAPLPPGFDKKMAMVSKDVSATVTQAMAAAFDGKSGKYNCVGCDYSGQNLSGKSFRGQSLSGADFSGSNLRNADFSNATLVGADFSHADLRGANFSNAKLTGCDFSRAQIDGINFTGVSMVGCDVDARSLTPAQAASLLRGCRTGCDFAGADLSGQDLRNIELMGADLSSANLRGANLTGARLEGVDLSGAQLDGAHFQGATLTGCDLSGVNLQNVDLSKARIAGSKMTPSR